MIAEKEKEVKHAKKELESAKTKAGQAKTDLEKLQKVIQTFPALIQRIQRISDETHGLGLDIGKFSDFEFDTAKVRFANRCGSHPFESQYCRVGRYDCNVDGTNPLNHNFVGVDR